MKFEIPEPLKLDQEELRVALQGASLAGGKTGSAAEKLAKLLQPHLAREEKDMLQPLGALVAVAKGELTDEMLEIPAKSDRLKTHVFDMVREHSAIIQAARDLLHAAQFEHKLQLADFTQRLLLRAWMDEVVFYPAAILVGEYLKLVLRDKDHPSRKDTHQCQHRQQGDPTPSQRIAVQS